MDIRRRIDAFEADWEENRLSRGGEPTREQMIKSIEMCRKLVEEVDALVQEETNQWAAEFKMALKGIDDAAKTK